MKSIALARRQMAETFQNPTGLGVSAKLGLRLIGADGQVMQEATVDRDPSAWAMSSTAVQVSNVGEVRFEPLQAGGKAARIEIRLAGEVAHTIDLARTREMEAGDILWIGPGDLIVNERMTEG